MKRKILMQQSLIQIENKMNNLTMRENASLPQMRDKKKDESVTSSNLLFPVRFDFLGDGKSRRLIKWLHYRCAHRVHGGQSEVI